jgi:clorobiocin biosynthesis protein CloN5
MTVEQTNQAAPPQDALVDELVRYVRDQFVDGDPEGSLSAETPLLEWGVLTSMNTAQLLTHIRERYGVDVPPTAITATHLRDVNSVAALVRDLRAATAA